MFLGARLIVIPAYHSASCVGGTVLSKNSGSTGSENSLVWSKGIFLPRGRESQVTVVRHTSIWTPVTAMIREPFPSNTHAIRGGQESGVWGIRSVNHDQKAGCWQCPSEARNWSSMARLAATGLRGAILSIILSGGQNREPRDDLGAHLMQTPSR